MIQRMQRQTEDAQKKSDGSMKDGDPLSCRKSHLEMAIDGDAIATPQVWWFGDGVSRGYGNKPRHPWELCHIAIDPETRWFFPSLKLTASSPLKMDENGDGSFPVGFQPIFRGELLVSGRV